MRHRRTLSATAVTAALCMMSLPAASVTIDIDVESEGQPVPMIEITFQTPDGETVSEIELVEVPSEPSAGGGETLTTAESDRPSEGQATEQQQNTTAADKGRTPETTIQSSPPTTPASFEIPDKLIGRDLVIVVRKDEQIIKKQPVTVQRDTSKLKIEALDPADATLSLGLSQPKACKPGQECKYEIAVRNAGSGIYSGPLFLVGELHGTIKMQSDDQTWFCKSAGGAKTICYINTSLQPDEKRSWQVTARLPPRVSQNVRNCLRLDTLDGRTEGSYQPLIQAVQIGLAGKGFGVGRPDGILGPKTKQEIEKYSAQLGLAPDASAEAVFLALFGMTSDRLARLMLEAQYKCEKLALITPPKKEERISKDRGAKTVKKKEERPDRTSNDEAVGKAIGIGIGIGLGVLGDRKSGKKHKKKYETNDYAE